MKKSFSLILMLGILLLMAGSSQAQRDPKQYLHRYLPKTAVKDSVGNYGLTRATFTKATATITGALSAGSIAATTTGATRVTGSITATDSTTSFILKDSAGKKWKLRVQTNGTLRADSTGLN